MGRECSDINCFGSGNQEEESQADHIRVYVPLDLSANAILRRLRFLICRYEIRCLNQVPDTIKFL